MYNEYKSRILVVLVAILSTVCNYAIAKSADKFNSYFADKESEIVAEVKTEFIARSVITKAYTLDMLNKYTTHYRWITY